MVIVRYHFLYLKKKSELFSSDIVVSEVKGVGRLYNEECIRRPSELIKLVTLKNMCYVIVI